MSAWLSFALKAGIFPLPSEMSMNSSLSVILWTSAEWRSRSFSDLPIGVCPEASGPWHMAHFDLKRAAPSAPASAKAGTATTAMTTAATMARTFRLLMQSPLFRQYAHVRDQRVDVRFTPLCLVCRHLTLAVGGDGSQLLVALLLDLGRAEVAQLQRLAHRRLPAAVGAVAGSALRFVESR